ncbi:MAG TPA: zinc-dependent metalloprotease [Gemmatimonadales bacterium]|nr:zinc-dependent metalloprotease [Gemmatimonadales bacterium]
MIRADDRGKDVPWRSFSEVTRSARVVPGVFTTYMKRRGLLVGLRPDQFDRDYLLVTQLSQGIGEAGLDGGASVRSDLVRFHRAGDRVELWVINPHVAAQAGSPMARTVAYSFGHSVARSFPIATIKDTNEILVDLEPLLLSDWADLATALQRAATDRKPSVNVAFDFDRSSLGTIQVFPTNLEAEVRLTYAPSRNLGLETVPDWRSVPLGVHYSLVELPSVPMRPRYADDRVGFFVSAIRDFSRDTADRFFVRYVNRWRLDRKDTAAVSEPVRPITFYIDRTVPDEWRPYVRAGILEWNRAFEPAGFRGAIRVLDAPADPSWNAADARYTTVRWTATHHSVYAIGPSNVDPRTGEILNADILISASWIQAWRGEAVQLAGPDALVGAALAQDSLLRVSPDGGHLCSYGASLNAEGTVFRAALMDAGIVPAGGSVPREYIGQALKDLVMHEVGHTLGLRHNFRGSAGITRAQLSDRTWTAQNGFGASVMDYAPPAVSLDRAAQGDYYGSTIGSYDRWAIRYGYGDVEGRIVAGRSREARGGGGTDGWTPDEELSSLQAIAGEAARNGHLYGSDEDAGFGRWGLDPTVTRYDQTDNPLEWARNRVALVNRSFDSLEARLVAPGQGYPRLRSAFGDLLSVRWYATLVATKYIGGAYTSRDHRGDPGARPAFMNVPAAEQRQALSFISAAAFSADAYHFEPDLLTRLAPSRWSHWGSGTSEERADFPLHQWAAVQQGALLNQLLDPAVLARIRDAELRAAPTEDVFTIPELFDSLTASIWAEAARPIAGPTGRRNEPGRISSVRRDLQRAYLNRMIGMVVNAPAGLPEDARAVARMTLTALGNQLDRSLARGAERLDPYTRAHLTDSRQRIAQALDAPMIQK